MKSVLGLDIGAHSIKAVQLVLSGKDVILEKYAIAEISGSGIKKEITPEVIKTLIIKNGITAAETVTSLSGNSVSVRYADFPKMPKSQVDKSLPFEIQAQIPVKIEEMIISSQIVEKTESGVKVLYAVSKKDTVGKRISLLKNAGLETSVLDIDMLALENSYKLNADSLDETVLLIDIGATVVNLNFLKDGISHFARDIYINSNDLAKTVINDDGKPDDTSAPILEKITNELSRNIHYFSMNYSSDGLDRIILSGGLSLHKNLAKYLSHKLNASVEIANPLQKIKTEKSVPPELLPKLNIAVCLALRGLVS